MPSTSTQDNSDRESFLLGDTREELLKAVKAHVDFKNLKEKNQRALVSELEQVARQMIRRVANVVHGAGHLSTPIRWEQWTVKKGNVEPKALVAMGPGIVGAFEEHAKGVLVFVDPDVFMGQRSESEIFPDQPDLMEQAQPAEDERPIAEVNAERLRKGIKPLPVEEGEAYGGPEAEHEAAERLNQEEADALSEGYAEEAPPTQPADGDLVEQSEEEGGAPAPSVEDYRLPDAEEVETPPVTLDKPVGRRRPPRAPRARDVPTGE